MAKPSNFIETRWRSELAYAIGLIATDGNLSIDSRHISFTSKDKDLCELYKGCLGIQNVIGKKARGGSNIKKYFVVQFGSKQFYTFLIEIGLTPAKSKTLGPLDIPSRFFNDFLRGCIDGDGSIGAFTHPESRYPQLRLRLTSASPAFLKWVHESIQRLWNINGGWIHAPRGHSYATLEFGKFDSLKILKRLYRDGSKCCLVRKYSIAKRYMGE